MNEINKIWRRHNRCVFHNTVHVRPIVKGAPKSASFILISTIYLTLTIYRWSTPLSINTPLTSSNHSLKRICYQTSRDQVSSGIIAYLRSWFPGWVIIKRGDIFWPPKDLQTFLSWPPRDLINNSFQGMIRRFQKCIDAQSPVNSICKINRRYWDEWSWFRSSLDNRSHINCIL